MLRFDGNHALGVQARTQRIDAVVRTGVNRYKCPIAQPSQEPKLDFATKQALQIPRIDSLLRKSGQQLLLGAVQPFKFSVITCHGGLGASAQPENTGRSRNVQAVVRLVNMRDHSLPRNYASAPVKFDPLG